MRLGGTVGGGGGGNWEVGTPHPPPSQTHSLSTTPEWPASESVVLRIDPALDLPPAADDDTASQAGSEASSASLASMASGLSAFSGLSGRSGRSSGKGGGLRGGAAGGGLGGEGASAGARGGGGGAGAGAGGVRRKPSPLIGSPMRRESADKLSNLGLGGLVAGSPGRDVVVVSGASPTSSAPPAARSPATLVVSVWDSRDDGEDGKGDFLGCVTLPAASLAAPSGEATTYELVPDNALDMVNGRKLKLVQGKLTLRIDFADEVRRERGERGKRGVLLRFPLPPSLTLLPVPGRPPVGG